MTYNRTQEAARRRRQAEHRAELAQERADVWWGIRIWRVNTPRLFKPSITKRWRGRA